MKRWLTKDEIAQSKAILMRRECQKDVVRIETGAVIDKMLETCFIDTERNIVFEL